MRHRLLLSMLCTVCLGWSGVFSSDAGAQLGGAFSLTESQGLDANAKPAFLNEVGIDQRIGEPIPLDLVFRDETGADVTLGDYFHKKPVILTLVYFECPMLCSEILNGLTRSIRPLAFTPGNEFDIVTVSFNPRETPELARAKKELYLNMYDRPEAETGWHFLTGDPSSIEALTEAAGFRYTYDEQTGQFAHGSTIMVVTPEGILSHYYFGIEYPTNDLRLSLIEASENKIGTIYDQILLYCYHYDPVTGKYGVMVMNVLRLGGVATIMIMGSFMLVMFRRDKKGSGNVPTQTEIV